jgi:sec-independent protein translocase protein TatA
MLQNIGLTEIVIILLLVVLFIGGSRLPIFGRGLGQAKTEFKKGLSEDDGKQSSSKKS